MFFWSDGMRLKAQANEKLTWPVTVSIDELLEQFIQIAEDNKITHLSETTTGMDKLKDAVKQQKTESKTMTP